MRPEDITEEELKHLQARREARLRVRSRNQALTEAVSVIKNSVEIKAKEIRQDLNEPDARDVLRDFSDAVITRLVSLREEEPV